MTREQVEKLAKIAAEKMSFYRGQAGCNTFGLEASDSFELLARYTMVRDDAFAAERAYQNAQAEYLKAPAEGHG